MTPGRVGEGHFHAHHGRRLDGEGVGIAAHLRTKQGVGLIKLFCCKFTYSFFQSFIFSHDIKIMKAVIKGSSLQKSVSIFMLKKFYEINPGSPIHDTLFSL
jgi:hypothetical protein